MQKIIEERNGRKVLPHVLVTYLHRQADEWDASQARVHGFLAQLATGSQEVLQYVGLLGDSLLAQARRGL